MHDPNATLTARRSVHANGRNPLDAALAEARCPVCSPKLVDVHRAALDRLALNLAVLDAFASMTAEQGFHQLPAVEDVSRFEQDLAL